MSGRRTWRRPPVFRLFRFQPSRKLLRSVTGVQELFNLNDALENTINIAWNEIKYVATINREYGDVPEIICFPQQLNQVFLNLLVNAGQAMEGTQGSITIQTWCATDNVFVAIADAGCGNQELVELVNNCVLRYELLQSLRLKDEAIYSSLAQAIELKDHYTRGHCDRVVDFTFGPYRCRS